MSKRFFILTTTFTVFHVVVTIVCTAISFTSGMKRFDNPDLPVGLFERACSSVAYTLLQPGLSFVELSRVKNMSSILQWGIMFLNSLIWGILIAVIFNKLSFYFKPYTKVGN